MKSLMSPEFLFDKVEFKPNEFEFVFMSTTRGATPYFVRLIPKRGSDLKAWGNYIEKLLIDGLGYFKIKYLAVQGVASPKLVDYCNQNGVKLCKL